MCDFGEEWSEAVNANEDEARQRVRAYRREAEDCRQSALREHPSWQQDLLAEAAELEATASRLEASLAISARQRANH